MSKALVHSRARTSEVPYTRLAFHNLMNYAFLAGSAALSYITWDTGLGPALAASALGLESFWLTVGCRTGNLARFFEFVHASDGKQLEAERQQKLLASLSEPDRERYLELEEIEKEIYRQVQTHPGIEMGLVERELDKIDQLVATYLGIAAAAARFEHLGTHQDLNALEEEVRRQEKIVERARDDESKRLAVKNLEISRKRLEKGADVRRQVRIARGQLNLLENTLKLLRDQIVTMSSPRELSAQVDELTSAMDAIEGAGTETDALSRRIDQEIAQLTAGG